MWHSHSAYVSASLGLLKFHSCIHSFMLCRSSGRFYLAHQISQTSSHHKQKHRFRYGFHFILCFALLRQKTLHRCWCLVFVRLCSCAMAFALLAVNRNLITECVWHGILSKFKTSRHKHMFHPWNGFDILYKVIF